MPAALFCFRCILAFFCAAHQPTGLSHARKSRGSTSWLWWALDMLYRTLYTGCPKKKALSELLMMMVMRVMMTMIMMRMIMRMISGLRWCMHANFIWGTVHRDARGNQALRTFRPNSNWMRVAWWLGQRFHLYLHLCHHLQFALNMYASTKKTVAPYFCPEP